MQLNDQLQYEGNTHTQILEYVNQYNAYSLYLYIYINVISGVFFGENERINK